MKNKEVYIIGSHPIKESIVKQYIDRGFNAYDCLDDCSSFIENRMNAELIILTSPYASDRLQEDCNSIELLKTLSHKIPDNDGKRPVVHVLFQSSVTLNHLLKHDLPSFVNKKMDIYPFTLEDMWAKKVLVELPGVTELFYPPLDRNPIISDSIDRVHVVISGFDEQAEVFAIHSSLIAHFPNYHAEDKLPIRTRITIVDENINNKRDAFVAKYQSLFDHSFYRTINISDRSCEFHRPMYFGKRKDFVDVEWEFVDGNITDCIVRDKITAWSSDKTQQMTVVISWGGDEENLNQCMSLPRAVYEQNIPVFVRISQKTIAENLISLADDNHIYPFGMCDCGYDISMPLVRMGKLLKYFYDCSYGDQGIPTKFSMDEVEKAWEQEFSMKMRMSNIYNVMTIPTKMHSVGHNRLDADTFYALNGDEIRMLAETEHNRWSVERLILGDRPCTDEEKEEIRQNIQEMLESRRADKEIPADLKRKYKKENHVHYDLCAYDELEIDPTGKNAQTYDYDLTASIPLIYKTFYEKVGNEKGTY